MPGPHPRVVRTECVIAIDAADVRKTKINHVNDLLHSGDNKLFKACLCVWTLRHNMCFERHKAGVIELAMGRLSELDGVICDEEEAGNSGDQKGSKGGTKPR